MAVMHQSPQDLPTNDANANLNPRKESRRRAQSRESTECQRMKKPLRSSRSFDDCKHSGSRKKNPVKRDRMSSSSKRDPTICTTDALGGSSKRDHRRRSKTPPTSNITTSVSPQKQTTNNPSPRSVRDKIGSSSLEEPEECAPLQELAWLCTCGEENEGRYNFCGMCATPKTWQCAGCDFDNKCKFKFCGMCGITKTVKTDGDNVEEEEEEEEPTTELAPNQWKCQGCDMVNPCPYVFCSMCGSSKMIDEQEEAALLLDTSFPPPFVTCRPEDAFEESLRSLESWSGE